MELAAILILLALFLAVGLYLAAPLMQRTAVGGLDESPEVSSLLAERDRVINALQELDFDNSLGKVPQDGYAEQRLELVQRGAGILRRLDELAPTRSAGAYAGQEAGARIEAAAAGERVELADDRIESMLASRRAARRAKSAGFCPRCGKPILAGDRFCPHCGKSLQ